MSNASLFKFGLERVSGRSIVLTRKPAKRNITSDGWAGARAEPGAGAGLSWAGLVACKQTLTMTKR